MDSDRYLLIILYSLHFFLSLFHYYHFHFIFFFIFFLLLLIFISCFHFRFLVLLFLTDRTQDTGRADFNKKCLDGRRRGDWEEAVCFDPSPRMVCDAVRTLCTYVQYVLLVPYGGWTMLMLILALSSREEKSEI
jgi:hypothetical protein